MSDVTKVLLAIVGVAVLATLVVNGQNSARVISSVGSAFSGSLSAAERG